MNGYISDPAPKFVLVACNFDDGELDNQLMEKVQQYCTEQNIVFYQASNSGQVKEVMQDIAINKVALEIEKQKITSESPQNKRCILS